MHSLKAKRPTDEEIARFVRKARDSTERLVGEEEVPMWNELWSGILDDLDRGSNK